MQRIRRVVGGVVIAAGLLSPGGCLEMEAKVVLRADGSGTQTVRVGMAEASMQALRRSVGVIEASAGGADPLDAFDRDKVEHELAERGLTMEGFRVWEERRRQWLEVKAAFADLDRLRQSPLTGGTTATWRLQPGPGSDEVRLVYYPRGEAAWKAARQQARDLAAEPDEVVRQFVDSRRRRLAGLAVTFELELPGKVLLHTANLELVDASTVRARMSADDVRTPRDVLALTAPRFETIFACAALRAVIEPPAGR